MKLDFLCYENQTSFWELVIKLSKASVSVTSSEPSYMFTCSGNAQVPFIEKP